MIAGPLMITGIVLIITGGAIAGGTYPKERDVRQGDAFWAPAVVGFVILGIGIAMFIAGPWVGFGAEGWGGE